MAFTGSRYVEDAGNGHYRVVWDGQVVYDGDLNGAQNAYNQWEASTGGSVATAPAPTTAAPPATPPLGTGGNTSWTDPATIAAQGTGGGYGGIGGLIDAAAYGNTQNFELTRQQVQAQIDLANKNYQLAVNADQRAQALLDLQKWQAELNRVEHEQQQYTDLAKTLLNAAVEKSSRPNDYYQYSKLITGGRDVFSQVSGGAPPAFQAPAGAFEPGNITDILARLGVPAYPQTTPLPGGTGGGTGGSTAGIPGVPPPGQSGVTQAQADAVADGLGIDRKFLYQYVQEKGSLPDLPSLNAWMTSKGYRNANGQMTGRVPNVGWQGAAGDQGPGARADAVPGAQGGSGPGVAATTKAPTSGGSAANPPGWDTGINPAGGYYVNYFASDPVARQNAQHITNDYAGEGREGQNAADMAEALAAYEQEQGR